MCGCVLPMQSFFVIDLVYCMSLMHMCAKMCSFMCVFI